MVYYVLLLRDNLTTHFPQDAVKTSGWVSSVAATPLLPNAQVFSLMLRGQVCSYKTSAPSVKLNF
jgi:hypothetical protein